MFIELKRLVLKLSTQGMKWLVFVEVPITAVTRGCVPAKSQKRRRKDRDTSLNLNRPLRIDIVLCLDLPTIACSLGNCMVGIELDGRSHMHPFPVQGCRLRGQETQDLQDDNKDIAIASHRITCLRFTSHTRHGSRIFEQSLELEMRRCEAAQRHTKHLQR